MVKNSAEVRFAEPVKMSAHAMMRMMRGEGVVPLCEAYNEFKDEPHPDFFGQKPRSVYIAVSEILCKPLFGEDIFGVLLVEQIKKKQLEGVENFIIPDSGFQAEAEVLRAAFGNQVYVVSLHRNGTCYSNDSRGRIHLDGCLHYEVRNNGTLGDLRVRVAEVLRDIENGWVSCND
jgi:hypothetical protein